MKTTRAFLTIAAGCTALTVPLRAAESGEAPSPIARTQMKSAGELIKKQAPPVIAHDLAEKITPENSRILVSLARQRACLMLDDRIYIDAPVSTGKHSATTPAGTFSILEKDTEHRSITHGDFVDKSGTVVRSGISMRVDAASSGTHFVSTPMRYFCRLNAAGLGIHAGTLPGYPSSHGSIRMHEDIARLFFLKVKVGTPVEIRAD